MRLASNASVPAGGPFIVYFLLAGVSYFDAGLYDFRACSLAVRIMFNVTASVVLHVRAQLLSFCATAEVLD